MNWSMMSLIFSHFGKSCLSSTKRSSTTDVAIDTLYLLVTRVTVPPWREAARRQAPSGCIVAEESAKTDAALARPCPDFVGTSILIGNLGCQEKPLDRRRT